MAGNQYGALAQQIAGVANTQSRGKDRRLQEGLQEDSFLRSMAALQQQSPSLSGGGSGGGAGGLTADDMIKLGRLGFDISDADRKFLLNQMDTQSQVGLRGADEALKRQKFQGIEGIGNVTQSPLIAEMARAGMLGNLDDVTAGLLFAGNPNEADIMQFRSTFHGDKFKPDDAVSLRQQQQNIERNQANAGRPNARQIKLEDIGRTEQFIAENRLGLDLTNKNHAKAYNEFFANQTQETRARAQTIASQVAQMGGSEIDSANAYAEALGLDMARVETRPWYKFLGGETKTRLVFAPMQEILDDWKEGGFDPTLAREMEERFPGFNARDMMKALQKSDREQEKNLRDLNKAFNYFNSISPEFARDLFEFDEQGNVVGRSVIAPDGSTASDAWRKISDKLNQFGSGYQAGGPGAPGILLGASNLFRKSS